MRKPMHRSMMQVFVKESGKALAFYRRAFDAEVKCDHRNADGTVAHAELDIYGQVFAISEAGEPEAIPGNTMMFCLHFGKCREAFVQHAYDVLKDDAKIHDPLGPCDYSPLHFCLIDQFGVNWCIFV